MGSVWVAREESPASGKERLVAIKVMRPEFAAHSEFRAMFLKEGQLVRSIEHDNVVSVYEVAEHEAVLWLTMEWVEGESLDTLFSEASKRRTIPAEMAISLKLSPRARIWRPRKWPKRSRAPITRKLI